MYRPSFQPGVGEIDRRMIDMTIPLDGSQTTTIPIVPKYVSLSLSNQTPEGRMIERNDTVLIVIDVQERMMPAISRADEVLANIVRLIEGCRELQMPMLVSEQYSKGLGPTLSAVQSAMMEWYRPLEKISFSAAADLRFMQQLEAVGRQTAIVCGVEAHVCVYQTARDLRTLGYDVEVVADAVGSRAEHNHRLALDKLTRHSVELTTVEMALFEMMQRADIPEFKAVSKIVK
jgi:nicotinamidase-related amidase